MRTLSRNMVGRQMTVYVIYNECTSEACEVTWTQRSAEAIIQQHHKSDEEDDVDHSYAILEADLEPMSEIVNDYFAQRRLTDPTKEQAFLFLTSELGEAADAIVQDAANWTRNNPQNKDGSSEAILAELGDVLMMLVKTSEKFGGNVIEDMLKKFTKKGFRR